MGVVNRVKAIIPNSGGVWFQTNFPLVESQGTVKFLYPPTPAGVPEIVRKILTEVNGVEQIQLSAYTLSVFATKAVTIWEVETQVLAVFREVYADKNLAVYGIGEEIRENPTLRQRWYLLWRSIRQFGDWRYTIGKR